MKKSLLLMGICCSQLFPAQEKISCGTSHAMSELYQKDPRARTEAEEFEKRTRDLVAARAAASATDCYVFPVVFHVYGTTQSGLNVNTPLINTALAWLNADFHGTNSDYNSVHNSFAGIRGNMPDITFALAQYDPSGNPTSGVVYYPATSGYGNANGYDAQIAADAWDNYRYMNVYIQNDLYNNQVYNNSGIAWYPNSGMSSNNTARVVYNGAYLGNNTNVEFASVLTHEFAHWMNLIHTFEGGCAGPNDQVNDTPPCDFSGASYGCHSSPTSTGPVSCGNLVNADNYMDYSGAGGCYKMFTVGQTLRMYATLQHPARFPLWQASNVIAAGLWQICSPTSLSTQGVRSVDFSVYPNPAKDHIRLAGHFTRNLVVRNSLGVLVKSIQVLEAESKIDVSGLDTGVYFIETSDENGRKCFVRFVKE